MANSGIPTIRVGDKFSTNYYGEVEVIRYGGANDIDVVFSDKSVKRVNSGSIRSGKIRNANSAPLTNAKCDTAKFVKAAIKKHGDKFGYSKVEYVRSLLNVIIICKVHGEFSQSPTNHLAGAGCMKCFHERKSCKSNDVFIADAIEKHGDRYDYSITEYISAHERVSIICKVHGEFVQRANSHLVGSGCQKCSNNCGFKISLPATLYVMMSGDMVKVGITNKKVSIRAKTISKSSGVPFIIVKEYPLDGKQALDTETAILKHMNRNYVPVLYKFDGSTECFIGVDIPMLIKEIDKELYER